MAAEMFWSKMYDAWLCEMCWDNEESEELGPCLADVLPNLQAVAGLVKAAEDVLRIAQLRDWRPSEIAVLRKHLAALRANQQTGEAL